MNMVEKEKDPSETHNSDTAVGAEEYARVQEVPTKHVGGENAAMAASSSGGGGGGGERTPNKKGLLFGIMAFVLVIVLIVTLSLTLRNDDDDDDGDDISDDSSKGSSTLLTWTPLEDASIAAIDERRVFQDFDVNDNMLVVVDVGNPDYSFIETTADLASLLDEAPPYVTHVRLYAASDDGDNKSWTLTDTLTLPDAHPLTGPGVHIAKQAPLVVVADAEGGTLDNKSHGSVRFYNVGTGMFELVTELTDDDDWGASISLNDNGTRVAIARTLARHPEGAVQVHELVPHRGATAVRPLGSPLYQQKGRQQPLTSLGASLGDLALSGDGKVLAVGVPLHNEFGSGAGQVRVWRLDEAKKEWMETPIAEDSVNYPVAVKGEPGRGVGKNVVLSTNGNAMATTTYLTSQVMVYQYDANDMAWTNKGQALDGEQVYMTADCTRLATLLDGVVQVYDYNSQDDSWDLTGAPVTASAVRLTNDGSNLVVYAGGAIETLALN